MQLETAQSVFNTALAAFTPKLNGNIGYSKGEQTVLNGIEAFEGTKATLSLTQVLNEDSPSGLTLFKAQRDLYKAKNTFNETKKNLEIKIIRQFYDALFAQRQLEIAQDNLALAEKKLKIAEDQLSSKVITESSFMDAKLSLNDSQISFDSAKSNAELTLLTLFNTLGLTPKEVKLKGDFTYNSVELSLDSLLKEAISNNLDIKNAQFDLEKAERGYKEAIKTDTVIGLSGGYSQNGQDLNVSIDSKNYQLGISYSLPIGNNTSSDSSPTWSIGLSVSLPIFDGGIKSESVKQAELQLKQAQFSLENTKKSIELSVRQSYQTVMNAKAEVERAKLNLSQKELLAKNQEIRFKLGLITQLDLDLANIQMKQASLDMDKAIVNYNISLLQLELILGKE
jgi:outer membrane protein